MLSRQAKILTSHQIKAVISYLAATRHPARNQLIFLLSVRAGLRAKEIASLKWRMVTDSQGLVANAIHLEDVAAKGGSGGVIPLCRELKMALCVWRKSLGNISTSDYVIRTERSSRTSAQVIVNLFREWYSCLGFDGCSSHSGRRTFITNLARRISSVGGTMRDVQVLARHASMTMTQRYIDVDTEAQRKVVELV